MKAFIFASALLLGSAALAQTSNEPPNCVNPGGGCDGSVPCCNPSVNACFRGRCVPVNGVDLFTLARKIPNKPAPACLIVKGTYSTPRAEGGLSTAIRLYQSDCKEVGSGYCEGASWTGCSMYPEVKCSSSRSCTLEKGVQFAIGKDSVVETGNVVFHNTAHGECQAGEAVLTLDKDRNLVRTAAAVACQDGYQGVYSETNKRTE
jgi:hypothetical protein